MGKKEIIFSKSIVSNGVKKRKIVTVDKKKFANATGIVATVIIGISMISPTVQFFNDQQTKTEMQMWTSHELSEAGFQIYNKDTRYYLTEGIDLFDLYLLLPNEGFNQVLNDRGYNSLEEFYAKNDYENFDEWKEESVEKFKEERTERRSRGSK